MGMRVKVLNTEDIKEENKHFERILSFAKKHKNLWTWEAL